MDRDLGKDRDSGRNKECQRGKDFDRDLDKSEKRISDRAFARVCRVSSDKTKDGDKSIAANQV